MPSESDFTVSPDRVKEGDEIKVVGPVIAVNRIIINDTPLTAYSSGDGVAARVTAAVPKGGYAVRISDANGVQTKVGVVIVD